MLQIWQTKVVAGFVILSFVVRSLPEDAALCAESESAPPRLLDFCRSLPPLLLDLLEDDFDSFFGLLDSEAEFLEDFSAEVRSNFLPESFDSLVDTSFIVSFREAKVALRLRSPLEE